ncbi:hypothetical protein FACS1894208_01190 [Clostridia bacterium]|nr:hypothetical protein FACS1894208_01190 [Clostridia bacterium]
MIELYESGHIPDGKIADIPILSGTETRQLNGAYTLNFTVDPRLIGNLRFTPTSVFRYGGIFYRQLSFKSDDSDRYRRTVSATDVFSVDAIERMPLKYEAEDDLAGHIGTILTTYLPWVTLESVPGNTPKLEFLFERQTVLDMINTICRVYGAEFRKVERETLEASQGIAIAVRFCDSPPFAFVKGRNVTVYSEELDTTNITTYLDYDTGEDTAVHTLVSEYAALYPPKRSWARFDLEDGDPEEQAAEWLADNDKPAVTIGIDTPFNLREKLDVGRGVTIQDEQGDFGIGLLPDYAPDIFPLRVLSRTVDLTGQTGAKYVIGNKVPNLMGNMAASFQVVKKNEPQSDPWLSWLTGNGITDVYEVKIYSPITIIYDDTFTAISNYISLGDIGLTDDYEPWVHSVIFLTYDDEFIALDNYVTLPELYDNIRITSGGTLATDTIPVNIANSNAPIVKTGVYANGFWNAETPNSGEYVNLDSITEDMG